MIKIRLPNNWRPRPYQRPAWRYLRQGGKRAVIVAHRRWGKDDIALHHTACAAFERPASYWHMLPEYGQARKAVWDAVNPHTGKRRVDEAFPRELRETTREDTMSVRFKNGSTWQLVGSDNFNSLVGAPPAGLIFSEYAIANPSAWAYLRPILLENKGWAAFIYTARGRNHGHDLLQSARKEPGWYSEVSTAEDTGVFTAEQLETERRQYVAEFGEVYGNALFNQEYLCSFDSTVLGSYYGAELSRAEAEGRIGSETIDYDLPVYSAWDLGVRDSTAIWIFQATHGGPRFIDFYQSSGAGVDHYAEWLRANDYKCEWDFVPHDARVREWGSGRTRIETMRALGLKPRLVAEHRLMDGINAARQTIRVARFDAEKTAPGVAALREYQAEYDRENKVLKATPLHNWASDPADGFRYAALAWRSLVAEQPVPPPRFREFTGINGAGMMTGGETFNERIERLTRRRRDAE